MTAQASIVPRRSLLYMPGANPRAMKKAQSLDCDTIIFDLEDAVAASAKTLARSQVLAALEQNAYGHRELVVRCNGVETPGGMDRIEPPHPRARKATEGDTRSIPVTAPPADVR